MTRRLSRRWKRRIFLGSFLVTVAGAVTVAALVRGRRSSITFDCARAARAATDDITVLVCQREYEDNRTPATGALLANALRRSGNRDAASALANNLLATTARSDAFYVLGKIAASDRKFDKAMAALSSARELHGKERRRAEVALDDQALAELHTQAGRFSDALRSLEECSVEAGAAADTQIVGHCHLAAAAVLSSIGYFDGATSELALAEEQFTLPRDLAWLWYERGNLEQEFERGPANQSHHKQAVANFENALKFATEAQLSKLILWIELNLVYSLAELRRTDEAERHHATATGLDLDNEHAVYLVELKARIAYRRGDLSLAFSLNEQVFPKLDPGDDDRFEVCVMQTRISLDWRDFTGAERWARCAIEDAEKIRAGQSVVELRPWVLASRREPYELLFTVLARTNRFEEALIVFDQWQGRTLLDAMSRPRPAASFGLAGTASKLQSLGQWLPVASSAPLMATGQRAVIEALRTSDLLALVVAERDVWRVAATGNQIKISKVGAFEKLRDLFAKFEANPTNRVLAEEMGDLIVPDELLRNRTTLHVVLDAPVASMPVVALRRGDKPLIAVRPVLRVPRLPAGGTCVSPGAAGGATILADSLGDLPDARLESDKVAARFNTTARVGAAATSMALFAARSEPILHIAVHADVDANGGILKLYDRAVSALEISATQLGPSLVVLSACSSAMSSDPELSGSLSTAFLASGSSHVVATLRPVADADALELTSRFYAEGGVKDPVRTLAAIQAKLSEGNSKNWPSFAVFGRDICAPPT